MKSLSCPKNSFNLLLGVLFVLCSFLWGYSPIECEDYGFTTCGEECCRDGENCQDGVCLDPSIEVLIDCFGTWVDTDSNKDHCGSCDSSCEYGEYCDGGECVNLSCPDDLLVCSETCVDITTDPVNCGNCNQSCNSGEYCSEGTCVEFPIICLEDLDECSETCVDTSNNPDYCGSCERSCESGDYCSGGECESICPGG